MNTTENNKLIAEFMGMVLSNIVSKEGKRWIKKGLFQPDYLTSELQYNSSWDWLMPVVEKIRDSEEARLYRNGKLLTMNIFEAIQYSGIEETYEAVVEFIKWHNEQK